MHEFEHTLLKILEQRGMSVAELAERAGYNPLFFRSVVSGKNRQVPVDFFIKIAEILDLSNEKKDELVRSWAFGVERCTRETLPGSSRAGRRPHRAPKGPAVLGTSRTGGKGPR